MDWNLFWTAFGSIVTAIASVTAAIAIVIAIKQYKQPLKKYISVTHGMAIIQVENVKQDEDITHTHITINIGDSRKYS